MNVKKTKSSKKIVLKITMSMTVIRDLIAFLFLLVMARWREREVCEDVGSRNVISDFAALVILFRVTSPLFSQPRVLSGFLGFSFVSGPQGFISNDCSISLHYGTLGEWPAS